MATITGEVVIHRPVEVVFDYVADPRNEVDYNPEMIRSTKATSGPIGVGTRFEATVKSRGRPLDIVIEVTEFDRPTRFGSRTTMSSADIVGGLTFAPLGSATRMTWSWQLRPKGLLRVLNPVIARLGRRQEQRIWSALKQRLETSASEATPGRPE